VAAGEIVLQGFARSVEAELVLGSFSKASTLFQCTSKLRRRHCPRAGQVCRRLSWRVRRDSAWHCARSCSDGQQTDGFSRRRSARRRDDRRKRPRATKRKRGRVTFMGERGCAVDPVGSRPRGVKNSTAFVSGISPVHPQEIDDLLLRAQLFLQRGHVDGLHAFSLAGSKRGRPLRRRGRPSSTCSRGGRCRTRRCV